MKLHQNSAKMSLLKEKDFRKESAKVTRNENKIQIPNERSLIDNPFLGFILKESSFHGLKN